MTERIVHDEIKISELSDALSLDGSEIVPLVQSGVTKRVSIEAIGIHARGSARVKSVHGRDGEVTSEAGDYVAEQITFTPGGNLASDTVQEALTELDMEKVSTTSFSEAVQTINVGIALKADDVEVVHLTGDETVAGTKTFSSSPVVPTPSALQHAANKEYVDGQVVNAQWGIDRISDADSSRSRSLLLFNRNNAFTYDGGAKTSHGWWGVMGDTARDSENTLMQSLVSHGIVSGSSAVTARVKTGTCDSAIRRIIGQVRVGLYGDNSANRFQPNALITGVSAAGITSAVASPQFPSSILDERTQTWFIATAPNGTRYLVIGGEGNIRSFALDANNGVISSTASGTVGYTTFPAAPAGLTWVAYTSIVAAKDNYVWVVRVDTGLWGANASGRTLGYLYSIANDGSMTLVWSETVINAQVTSSGGGPTSGNAILTNRFYSIGAYIVGNTAHTYADFYASYIDSYSFPWNNSYYARWVVSLQGYATVNISVITTFTYTLVNQRTTQQTGLNSSPNPVSYNSATGTSPVGYDGTNLYVVMSDGVIFQNNTFIFVSTGQSSCAGANNNILRFTSTLPELTTAAQNVFFNNAKTQLIALGTTINGSIGNSGTQTIFVWRMTGSNSMDDSDAFVGILSNFAVNVGYPWSSDTVSLSVNGSTVSSINHALVTPYTGAINAALPAVTNGFLRIPFALELWVNIFDIEFSVSTNNPNSIPVKLGFGLTGGTFASPTGGNDSARDTSATFRYGQWYGGWSASYLVLFF